MLIFYFFEYLLYYGALTDIFDGLFA